jgi:hypothetical protein
MPLRAAAISSKVTGALLWANAGHTQEIESRQTPKLKSGAEKKFHLFIIMNGN